MIKVYLSPEAQNDLKEIDEYIAVDLSNPDAALSTVARITARIRELEAFAEIGAPLAATVGYDSGYRYLVCGSYLAFYRIEDTGVYVDRVLYGKRDYAAMLLETPNREN